MMPSHTQAYLDSLIDNELHLDQLQRTSFKLDRVQELLEALAHPEDGLTIIHVAGSKGKGSTCSMIAAIFQKAGYKVGLYTSPHLNHYRERVRVLDPEEPPRLQASLAGDEIFSDAISASELDAVVTEIRPEIEKKRLKAGLGRLSFFEFYTVLAIYYFRQRGVDLVVLETGLGGRLDATNAMATSVCALTPISLEHTHILGGTLREIAGEKAAIIKDSRQQVVIGPQPEEAREIIVRRCEEFSIRPVCVGADVAYEFVRQGLEGQTFHVRTSSRAYENLQIPLLGRHQLANASTAIGVAECLEARGLPLSSGSVSEGLRKVFWPGRFEVVRTKPFMILDGAHNQASSHELVSLLRSLFPGKFFTFIVGISNDKEWIGIGRELHQVARRILVTRAGHPRARDFKVEEIEQMFPGRDYQKAETITEAMTMACQGVEEDDIVVITGSLFLVAEARRLLSQGAHSARASLPDRSEFLSRTL